MSAMTALEHANREDLNCVTVAVDGVRLHKTTCDWRLDRDIEYYRCSPCVGQCEAAPGAGCDAIFEAAIGNRCKVAFAAHAL
jgi:hypothetical protein